MMPALAALLEGSRLIPIDPSSSCRPGKEVGRLGEAARFAGVYADIFCMGSIGFPRHYSLP